MKLKEFIIQTHEENEYLIRPIVVCADGFNMSVQGSRFHYCNPRMLSKRYAAMEIGYPSKREKDLMPYAEEPKRPTGTVYGYVPCRVIEKVIEKHGGIDAQKTFTKNKLA